MSEFLAGVWQYARVEYGDRIAKLTREPYYMHAEETAAILYDTDSEIDETLLAAAILHDIVTHAEVPAVEIIDKFGSEIANIVMELTTDIAKEEKIGKQIYMKQKMEEMSDDALTVKLADRIDISNKLVTGVQRVQVVEYVMNTISAIQNLGRKLNPIQQKLMARLVNSLILLKVRFGIE